MQQAPSDRDRDNTISSYFLFREVNGFLVVHLFPLHVWAIRLQTFDHLKKLAVHKVSHIVDFQGLMDD